MQKKKHFAKTFCILFALICSLTITAATAFAEELPIDRATENSATVSKEVDIATNEDPSMGTSYFMYLAPDIVVMNPPQMGVDGPHTDLLVLLAVFAGLAYLCVSAYAYGGKENRTAHAV